MSNPFSHQTQNEGMYNSQQSFKKMELLDKIKALHVEQTELNNRLHANDVEAEDQELGAAFDAVTREIAEKKKQLKDEYGEDYDAEYGSEGGRRKKRTHRRKSHRSKSRAKKSRRSKSRAKKSRRSKH
jgi:hypothetical protein